MPEISRFYGIVVKMFWNDHEPPHFHVEYSGQTAVMDIRTLALIHGKLPARAMGLTVEWATLHQQELLDLWERARTSQELHRIDPLP